jgi:hypothetical protein
MAIGAVGVPLLLSAGSSTDSAASPVDPERALFGFGDSSAIYEYPGAPTPERLAGLEAGAGAEVGRFTISWESLQPAPPTHGRPQFEWDQFDRFVEALDGHGIRPLPVLLGAPGWARDPPPICLGSMCPPSRHRLDQWAAFVAAVARRYPEAAAIEIWNEPNHVSSWRTLKGPDPERYAALFERSVRAVRSVDPELPVLIGSVAAAGSGGLRKDTTIPDFLNGFYDTVDPAVLDSAIGLGVHAYPSVHELDRLEPNGGFATTLRQVRGVRDARDPRRLLWVTELGASTTAARVGPPVSEAEQASAVRNALTYLEGERDVRAALVYTVVERPPHILSAEQGYGVVERGPGFAPKLAYCAIAAQREEPRPAGC